MVNRLLYFAYGSNLHPTRLGDRAPSVELVGTAVLEGHALRFHKRGADGSGKCNALATGSRLSDAQKFGAIPPWLLTRGS